MDIHSKRLFVFLTAVLAILHSAAVVYGWYETVPWYDVMLHFLWGILAVLFFSRLSSRKIDADAGLTILCALGFAALISVLWEFFEFTFDILVASKGLAAYAQKGLTDTMSDVFWQMAGGAFTLPFISGRKSISHKE